jgi:Holliday junction DNA helicase RuvA
MLFAKALLLFRTRTRYFAFMIGRLVGTLVDQDGADVTLDVDGVGYEVAVPDGSLARAEKASENRVVLWIQTIVREDAMLLYGFATQWERALFRLLISVSNVGPKTGIAIMSAISPDDFVIALSQNDSRRLTAVPGIGKKTAERLILELADKVAALPGSRRAGGTTPPKTTPATGAAGTKIDTLRTALLELQFRPSDVDRALTQLADRLESSTIQELVVAGLQLLHRAP